MPADGDEELRLTMPPNHPLNRVVPIEQQLKELAAKVELLSAQNARLIDMLDKIGGMTFEIYNALAARQRPAKTGIVVPGRG